MGVGMRVYHAVRNGDILQIELLIREYGISNKRHYFSVIKMATKDMPDYIDFLLETRAEMFRKEDKIDALVAAVDYNRLGLLQKILDVFPDIDLNAYFKGKSTALTRAIQNNAVDVTKFLLERDDIDVDRRYYRYRTPLMLALERGRPDIAEIIVERTKNVNATDENWNTALHIACKKVLLPMAEKLLQKGAEIRRNGRGKFPIDLVPKKFKAEFAPLFSK